jgi:hypothetical protein
VGVRVVAVDDGAVDVEDGDSVTHVMAGSWADAPDHCKAEPNVRGHAPDTVTAASVPSAVRGYRIPR